MLFSTLYFQYRGLTDWQAGFATSCGYIGDLVATLFGGALSDALHRRCSLHGPPTKGDRPHREGHRRRRGAWGRPRGLGENGLGKRGVLNNRKDKLFNYEENESQRTPS